MKTRSNVECVNVTASGTLAVTGAVTAASTVAVTGAVTAASTVAVTGAVTAASTVAATGEVSGGALRVGEASSASDDYDFFQADGTNRPKMNAVQLYDYGQNQMRGVYLYNGAWKFTAV